MSFLVQLSANRTSLANTSSLAVSFQAGRKGSREDNTGGIIQVVALSALAEVRTAHKKIQIQISREDNISITQIFHCSTVCNEYLKQNHCSGRQKVTL